MFNGFILTVSFRQFRFDGNVFDVFSLGHIFDSFISTVWLEFFFFFKQRVLNGYVVEGSVFGGFTSMMLFGRVFDFARYGFDGCFYNGFVWIFRLDGFIVESNILYFERLFFDGYVFEGFGRFRFRRVFFDGHVFDDFTSTASFFTVAL